MLFQCGLGGNDTDAAAPGPSPTPSPGLDPALGLPPAPPPLGGSSSPPASGSGSDGGASSGNEDGPLPDGKVEAYLSLSAGPVLCYRFAFREGSAAPSNWSADPAAGLWGGTGRSRPEEEAVDVSVAGGRALPWKRQPLPLMLRRHAVAKLPC